eukprot:SAG31_NODE_20552_length_571_cov_0.942797_1_plen_58_part_00
MHAMIAKWTGSLPGIPKLNSRQGLLPGEDPLDDSSDDDSYWGDDPGNYTVDNWGDDY